MSVFPFPNVTPNEVEWTLVSNVGTHVAFSGATQTVDRTGERWQAQLTFHNLKDPDARRLKAWASGLNGQQHRFTLHDHSYSISGAITATEMVDVPFNATNWACSAAAAGTLTAVENGVRFKVGSTEAGAVLAPLDSSDGISAPVVGASYAASISSYDSRTASDGGAAPPVALAFRQSNFGPSITLNTVPTSTTGKRIVTYGTAPATTTFFVRPGVNSGSAGRFGGTVDLRNLSVARCFLADNGFNALTYAEQLDNAAWTKTRATINADAATAPDGSMTADELVEDSTAASTHFIEQAYTRDSVDEYWTGSVYFKSNTSQRIRIFMYNGIGSDATSCYFDATTGAVIGSPALGGSATNAYATIHDIGNDWYRARLSARFPASTSIRIVINLADGAANTVTFDGDGSSGLYLWGVQLQRGGQLGRYTPTTTTAATTTTQSGKSIWVKGLDASTDGQLLPGDRVEINGQVVMLTSQLDGDASGIGLLECTPRIRTTLSDETAVVLYKPTGKFMLANDVSWRTRPGGFTDVTISCVEDIA